MSSEPPSNHAEALLAQAGWIRRLARSLVRDAHLADDLSQETLALALEHRPQEDRPLRGWLGTVLRNLVREERRRSERRGARERDAARGEALAAPHEVVGKVALQRQVVQSVLELEEPYRTAILLRYFEECSPKRIADELDVPLATVKSRLARGLDKLRARLDRDHGGDGRAWLVALLPLAGRPLGAGSALPTTLSIGAIAVNAKLVLSLAALTVAGAALAVFLVRDEDVRAEVSEVARAEPAAAKALEMPEVSRMSAGAAETVATERQPIAAAQPEVEKPAATAAAEVFRGRVVDVQGAAVAGVEVRRWSGSGDATSGASAGAARAAAKVVTDGQGSFELEDPAGPLSVSDQRWTTVLAGRPVSASTGHETTIVVAPRAPLEGEVRDEFGLPLPGALLRVALPAGFRAGLGRVLDYSLDVEFATRSDERGLFALLDAPAVPGSRIHATLEGYVPLEQDLALASARTVLVLARPRLSSHTLSGIVVDATGRPVEDARVSFGLDVTKSRSGGAFSFDLEADGTYNRMAQRFFTFTPDTLIAIAPDHLPGRFEAKRGADGAPVWPDRVVLQLGEEPFAIAGRVVDEEGRALEDVQVWIGDPTFFGGLGDPATAEEPRMTCIESELAGIEPGWTPTTTDEDGRFRIEGLCERDYVLHAMDPETLLRTVVEDVPAGRDDATIVLSSQAAYPSLRGTVVDRHGRGIAGVHVGTMCDALETRFQGQTISTHHAGTEGVTTDAEGRFELRRVPKDLAYLRLDGADTLPLEWGRHVEGGLRSLVGEDFDAVVIELHRRCHIQVELADPSEADELSVLDATGAVLEISEFTGDGRREGDRQPIENGRSAALGASDAATVLVLFKGGAERRRIPIALVPGQLTTLRP